MEQVKITVIGAGLVGLAIASVISKKENSLYVLEKNEKYGLETSSRNSEVIHSGIYYPKDTLKALLCVEGNKKIYEICKENNILHNKTGKLIAAVTEDEVERLHKLYLKGKNNGVNDLNFVSSSEIKKIEPYITAKEAIISPSTGIINAHNLMDYYAGEIKKNSAEIVCGAKVIGIEMQSKGYKIDILESDGEVFSFLSEIVINSAGLESDTIAALIGIDIKKEKYELHYCKGDYFSVASSKSKLVSHLIYPVADENLESLGIHITLGINGSMRLGPSSYYIDRSNFDYKVDDTQAENFYESAKKFFPALELSDITPEMSGIRSKLQAHAEPFRDFIIKHEKDKTLDGFINLIGIESPGLTSAPAIANYVLNLLIDDGLLS